MNETLPVEEFKASLLVKNQVIAVGTVILRDGTKARHEFQPEGNTKLDAVSNDAILKLHGTNRELRVLNFEACKAVNFGSGHYHFQFTE